MRVNRFVVDTNIWISYFITNNLQGIINIIDFYEIAVFSCDELIDEFANVLKYEHLRKYNVSIPKSVKLLKDITTHFTITYPIKQYIPEDSDDNYVIALALQTNSGFVTSSDSSELLNKVMYVVKKVMREEDTHHASDSARGPDTLLLKCYSYHKFTGNIIAIRFLE